MVFSEAEGNLIICQNYKVGAEIDKNINLTRFSWYYTSGTYLLCTLSTSLDHHYKESHALFLNLISSSLKLPKSRNFGWKIKFGCTIWTFYTSNFSHIPNLERWWKNLAKKSISSLSDLWIIAFLKSIQWQASKSRTSSFNHSWFKE